MKKPKLKKGEKVAYRNNENILLLAWRDKRLVTVLSTWSTSKSEPVRRKVRGRKEEEMVEKPSVIANYMKNMGGVDTADQYCATYCFLRRTLKWWRKLFFWGLEVSIINAYVLYVESCKNSSSNPMSHIKFRRELVMALVGDFRQGGGASTRGRTSTSDSQQRLNGMLHVIIPHPEKKHKDCIVCSKRNVPGGRRETTYICETCDRKPGLRVETCFKRYHTLEKFKL